MSEYQYYEFMALDTPLTRGQLREVRQLSTRARISPTRFVNEYQWGNFKGNPLKMMEKYYDAFVYYANWGSRWLMLRLPRELVELSDLEPYRSDEALKLHKTARHLILSFESNDDSGDWEEEEDNWMAVLTPLRDELLGGDLRPLYIGWLAGIFASADEDEAEPPIPPGLRSLTAAQTALADFLRVDDDVMAVAAEGNSAERSSPQRADYEAWLKSLPTADKNAALLELLEGNPRTARGLVSRRFLRHWAETRRKEDRTEAPRRTTADLCRRAEELSSERNRRAEKAAARKEAEEAARKEAERTKALDQLAAREPAAWRQVEQLIATKQPNSYDQAVRLLADLRELAVRNGAAPAADAKLGALRQRHRTKPSFIRRLDDARLP